MLWCGRGTEDIIGLVTHIDYQDIATVLAGGKLQRWSVERLMLMNYREL